MSQKMYHKNININMPDAVKEIIGILHAHGYEAFAVGGCVRDSILFKEPKDWDITTSAQPEETKALFRRTIDTGIEHGTVTIMIDGTGYEVTTYRVDGKYEDSRHPKEVTFTVNLEEDLKRRDFTINAMAYNETAGVVDCFNGVDDLNNDIIRCVGNAIERFSEDALRMLRAIRFSAVLGFDICNETKNAIIRLAPTITKISRERIQVELDKLLMSDHPEKTAELYNTGLMKYIFNSTSDNDMNITQTDIADKHINTDNVKLLISKLITSPKDHYIRWAVFVSYVSADNILKSLKFDNNTIKICNRLVKFIDEPLPADEAGLRRTIVKIGKDIFEKYYLPYRKVIGNITDDELEKIYSLYNVIISRGDCLSIKELAINGSDLASIGIAQGRLMGDILNHAFELVLEDHTMNDKNTLIEIASKF